MSKKIVSAEYEPVPEGMYSSKVPQTIQRCLTVEPEERPDIFGVAATISDILLSQIDKLKTHTSSLEKKLDKERKRTRREVMEAYRSIRNDQRLPTSQGNYDRESSLSTSNGSMGYGKGLIDSDGENTEEFEEQYRRLFPLDSSQNSALPNIDSGYGPDLTDMREPIGTSDGKTYRVRSPKRNPKDLEGKDSRISNYSRNSRDLSPLPPRPKTEQAVNKNERLNGNDDDVFAKPRPLAAGSKGPRRLLPLDDQHPSKQGTNNKEADNNFAIGRHAEMKRTQSCTSVEILQRRGSAGILGRWRPTSATATISISPRKVRQINDPILQMLNQLHKIVFITQLSPSLSPNPQRRVIEQFKKALFGPQSNAVNLKNEVKKLLEGSKDFIDIDLGPSWRYALSSKSSGGDAHADSEVSSDYGITYEHLQTMVENVLNENDYYEVLPNARSDGSALDKKPKDQDHTDLQTRDDSD